MPLSKRLDFLAGLNKHDTAFRVKGCRVSVGTDRRDPLFVGGLCRIGLRKLKGVLQQ